MSLRHPAIPALGLALAATCCAAPLMAEEPAFTFAEPEVLKLDWSTRALKVHDINGDGRNDLAVINNDISKIELFFQQEAGDLPEIEKLLLSRNRWSPVLEDARFNSRGITVGFSLFDLAVGDLDGDGLGDLAYTGRDVPLTIRYQDASGEWTQTHEYDNFDPLGWAKTLEIADLEGDGASELLVLSSDALRIFRRKEDRRPEPEVYYITGENPFNLMTSDISRNGRLDLLYVASDEKQSLILREQQSDGKFGPERHFRFDHSIREVVQLPTAKDEPPLFGVVDAKSGTLEFFHIARKDRKEKKKEGLASEEMPRPEIHPVAKPGRKGAHYAIGDLTGNSRDDIVAANPERPEMMLYAKKQGGYGTPRIFPSFSGVSSLATGRFYKGNAGREVVLVSAEEKTIGLTRLDEDDRLTFPRNIRLEDAAEPLACTAIDLNGDNYDELVLITNNAGDSELLVAQPVNRKDPAAGWEILSRKTLEGVRRKPEAVRALDVFGPDRSGLMVFTPREGPVFLASEKDGPYSFEQVGRDSPLREGLLRELNPAQISVFDATGDGEKELVTGHKGYGRALRFSEGEIEIVDQFNARSEDDVISAVLPGVEDGEVVRLILFIGEEGEFQFLDRESDGVFRYRSTQAAGSIELVDWIGPERHGDSDGALVFTGADRFWVFPEKGETWYRKITGGYETELEDVGFTHLAGGRFGKADELGLVAVDGKNHAAEILTSDDDGWQGRLHWEIFQRNMHYRGRTGDSIEPREIVVADFNNDTKPDFAFLIHDRILFYLQE
ncbi:MAG: FG-GAP-like repeat-containing protein [Opitutales bacterium]